jgi:membrane protein
MGATAAPREHGIKRLLHLPPRHLVGTLFKKIQEDDITGLGAEIAYNAIFAIPAFLLFLVTLAAVVNQFTGVPVAGSLQTIIAERAPADTRPLLEELVQGVIGRVSGLAVSIGAITTIVLALWGGAGGMDAVIKAFNHAYDVKETRPFVRQKLTSIGLTLLSAILVVSAFVLFVFGGNIGAWVANLFGLGSVFTLVWNLLRWPLAIIFIAFLLAVVYYFGPNIQQSFRWISPGSIVATILWLLIVLGFKFYLLVSNPGSAYGVAGSVLVLLFFLYLSGMIVVLGAEINAVLEKHVDRKTITDLAHHPEKVESPEEHAKAKQRAEQVTQGQEPADADAGHPKTHGETVTVAPEQTPTPPQAPEQKHGIAGTMASAIGVMALGWLTNRIKRNRANHAGAPGAATEDDSATG